MYKGQPVIVPFPSSVKNTSRTVEYVRGILDLEFGFTKFVDGSREPMPNEWSECTWVQVDNGNVEAWLRKVLYEREKGHSSVVLMPARTSTSYFHDFVLGEADEVRFLRGRLLIPGTKKQSPYATLLAIYKAQSPVVAVETAFTDDKVNVIHEMDTSE